MSSLFQKLVTLTAMTALVVSSLVTTTHFHGADGNASCCDHEHAVVSSIAGLESIHTGDCCPLDHSDPFGHPEEEKPAEPDSDHCSICRLTFESAAEFDFQVDFTFSELSCSLCPETTGLASAEFPVLYLTRGPPRS